ncbi:MFS transporter [Blastococcus sp. Marseille-P5729]|uniref:MFS transporter n=1 Tax=Blastococcus sp. Marseille-P5729 TaxID=2086582 RepID=UPI000D0E469E|nr:MFS transporter [Blastococcus sp. Marseille-P5729]
MSLTTYARREDGGSGIDSGRAWLIVVATFLSTFTGFGLVYSFGVFFESMASEFDAGRAATAFIPAITSAIYFTLGLFTGRIGDRFGPRPLLVAAAASLAAGMLLTSRVESLTVGYVTYGLGLGIAVACAYVPMVAFVGGWFFKKRTTALGVAVSGIGVGTLVMAPVAQALVDAHGWRTAFVILGISGAAAMLIAAVLAKRPPHDHTETATHSMRDLMRNPQFVALYANGILIGLAILIPFVFLKDYSVGHGIRPGSAAILVGLVGASSVIGRLGLGALGARFDSMALLRFSFILMTLSFFLWLFSGDSFTALLLFAGVFGVGYGGYIALMPATMASIFGPVGLGRTLGLLYTSAAIGGLVGPALVGGIIDATSYTWGILATMAMVLAAAACLFFVRPERTPPQVATGRADA